MLLSLFIPDDKALAVSRQERGRRLGFLLLLEGTVITGSGSGRMFDLSTFAPFRLLLLPDFLDCFFEGNGGLGEGAGGQGEKVDAV